MFGSQPPLFTPRNMPSRLVGSTSAAPGDTVLAVGREDVVVVASGPAGADLGGLLAEQRGPQAQLALALEGGGLGVEAAGQHHVPVQAAQVVGGEVDVRVVGGVLDALALGGQQLDEVRIGARPGRLGGRLLGGGTLGGDALRSRGRRVGGRRVGALGVVVRVVPVLLPALRRGLRAAVLSTVTCAPPSVRPPGLPGNQCGSPVPGTRARGGCHSAGNRRDRCPGERPARITLPSASYFCETPLTCDFAWISK